VGENALIRMILWNGEDIFTSTNFFTISCCPRSLWSHYSLLPVQRNNFLYASPGFCL